MSIAVIYKTDVLSSTEEGGLNEILGVQKCCEQIIFENDNNVITTNPKPVCVR